MAVDKVLIKRKISLISEDIIHLKPLAGLSLSGYLDKYENEILTERYLERIIGRMIDINYHIITELGHPPPRDYFQSFVELGRLKVIPFDLADRLTSAAGLRNRLAHEYDDIDEKLVYSSLQSCFKDIPPYLKAIHSFIETL
jgi:uncharacterized protein YutE (UPF0331/DUF86 family)